MKYNWTTKKLSEIAYINPRESIGKGVVAKKVPMDKLQPFCRDVPEFVLEEYKGGTKFRNGDTIMARITPCLENGKIAKVSILSDDEVGFGSTEYIVFRAIDGISDADFLYYLICSPLIRNPAIKSMVGSSGRQRVQTDVVANLDIELPPIEEQRKIGGLLKAIDDKIELNNKINNNLEQQAKALYKDWFFDFSPFSSDGNLPNSWRLGTVGDIIQLHDSKRVPLSGAERDKMAKVYPYYGATSLMDYVDDYLFDGIYLLLGEDGTVVDSLGFPILQYVYGQFWVNNHAHIITGKEGFSVEELYLFFSLTNIKSIVTGAVQQKVSQQNLKKVPAIIPSKKSSRVTIDNIRRILSSFFSWLEDEDYILKSPVRRIHRVKTGTNIKETYSDEALELMRDNCSELRDLAIIDMLASTGMRVGEMVLLNRNDIDFNERECVVFGKGSKERVVYFDARTKIHLQNYLESSRARRKVRENSIIYSTVRPNQQHYGIIKKQPDNFLVSTGFTVIDVDTEKAVADYIYYVLTQQDITEHLQAIAEQSVSAYPSLKPSDIENLEISLPDIDTQKRVVSILSAIDAKITKNAEINNNLAA